MRNWSVSAAAVLAAAVTVGAQEKTRIPPDGDPWIRIDVRDNAGVTEIEWRCSIRGPAQGDREHYWFIEFWAMGRLRGQEIVLCDLRTGGRTIESNAPPLAFRGDSGSFPLDWLDFPEDPALRGVFVDVWSPTLRDGAGRAKKPERIWVGELPPGLPVSISTQFGNAPPR